MARRFTFHRKKRGDRVTGSKRMASMGEALLFAACLLVGAIALGLIINWMVVPQWHVNQHYVETACSVVAPPTVIAKEGDERTRYYASIPVLYRVGPRTYESTNYDFDNVGFANREQAQMIAGQFQLGKSYPCWYDPQAPERSVLVRGYGLAFWLVLLLPIAFLAIGVGGFVYTLWQAAASRERRAALAKRAADIELFERDDDQPRFPTVPRDTDLKNSPGTQLAYRLPISTSPGWKLFMLTMASVTWNGLVIVFAVIAVRKYFAGQADWMLSLIVVPFAAAGVWLVYHLLRLFFTTSGIGATRVEISEHPLMPGQQYDLFIAQDGNLFVERFEVLLVCEEQATFRQGTDTVTDKQVVSTQSVFENSDFEVRPGKPYEARCRLSVPRDAMHSFRADHNMVNWKLVVRGSTQRWPNYERQFPVIVVPERNGA